MTAEVVLTGTAAAHFKVRALPRSDARSSDLTLSKIRSPRI